MNTKKILLPLFLLLFTAGIQAKEVYKLNSGWFIGQSVTDKEYFKRTSLPHSWTGNELIESAQYTRELSIPQQWEQKQIYLRFNGVSQAASLFVNNRFVGEHKGAYTAFVFDITPFIIPGASNIITLDVNNLRQINTLPLSNDYFNYGGIFRDVELVVSDKTHFSPLIYGSAGLLVRQQSVTDTLATIQLSYEVLGLAGDSVRTETRIYKDSQIIEQAERNTAIKLDGTATISVPFELRSPRLWNGKEDPFRYRAEVLLYDKAGKISDRIETRFGLRYFSVDREKGFFLNGKSYPLYGVTVTQDRYGVGSAYSEADIENDFDVLKELGATAVRTTIGPMNQQFYELCDEEGIVVWCDFPFASSYDYQGRGFVNSYTFMANGEEQLNEMLYQYNNHPSIAIYGIFNNISSKGDNPLFFIDKLNRNVKSFSPDRLTAGTSMEDGKMNFLTDLIGWGQYFGWREGSLSDFKLWVSTFNKNWNDLYPGLSDFGAEGVLRDEYNPSEKYGAATALRPQEYQKQFHMAYSKELANRKNFWGYFVNSLFDYRSSQLDRNKQPIFRNFGLVTYDRSQRKDAFYLYKALWNKDDKFVFLSAKGLDYLPNEKYSFTVFSNCDKAELILNGVNLGPQQIVDGRASWENVRLNEGINTLKVIGDNQEEEVIEIKTIKKL